MSSPFGTRPPEDTPTPRPPAPPQPPPVMMPFSQPTQAGPPPSKPMTVKSVALGFSQEAEATQLPPGVASQGSNWVSYMGGLTPRPGLSLISSLATNPKDLLTPPPTNGWIGELIDITNLRTIYLLGAQPIYYSGGSWNLVSRLSSSATFGSSGQDATPYYRTSTANYEVAFTDTVATFSVNNAGVYSIVSGSPGATYVTAFDDRLVVASVLSPAINPQRVQWSAPTNADNWIAPDGGAQDLDSAHGPINRIIASSDRLLVFFNNEIWQGLRAPFPFGFQFTPLDSNIGTRFSWSVTQTPLGVAFLGSDFKVYIIPPGSTPVAISPGPVRLMQENVPTSAFNSTSVCAQYVEALQALLVTYQSRANNGNQGVLIHLDATQRGMVDPIGFDVGSNFSITRLGFTSMASNQVNRTAGPQRVLIASAGTGYALELNSNATTDIGTAIDCRRFLPIANPDPTTRLHVREVRIDYRNGVNSSSSLSLRMSPDFGSTFPVDTALALPQAPFSAQTKLGVSMSAIYPGIELRHASGATFTVQGISAVVESVGNG